MRLRIPKPMYFIAFAGMALFMGSCAKNTTIIYGNGEDNLPETPQRRRHSSLSMLLSKAET